VAEWQAAALLIECAWRQKIAREKAFDLLTSYKLRLATKFLREIQAKWVQNCYTAWKSCWEKTRDEKNQKAFRFCRRLQMKCVVVCLSTWKEDWRLKRKIKALGDRVFRGRLSHYYDLWYDGVHSVVDQRVSRFLLPLQALARGYVYRSSRRDRVFRTNVKHRSSHWEKRRRNVTAIQRVWRGSFTRSRMIRRLYQEAGWEKHLSAAVAGGGNGSGGNSSGGVTSRLRMKQIPTTNHLRWRTYSKLKNDLMDIQHMIAFYNQKLDLETMKHQQQKRSLMKINEKISTITPMIQDARWLPVSATAPLVKVLAPVAVKPVGIVNGETKTKKKKKESRRKRRKNKKDKKKEKNSTGTGNRIIGASVCNTVVFCYNTSPSVGTRLPYDLHCPLAWSKA
jgi:hypothetical protein